VGIIKLQNSENFYVDSQSKLQPVIKLIKAAKIFAMDTEFTRETTYYPILSIIQIAVKNAQGAKESFIIDCLCDLDLSELFAIIADPKIIKILHSSAQDLQIFHHKSNQLPQGIVDTQVMANFCDLGFSVGYSGLVETLFNQQLDKKQQRSNWQLRPLSQKQVEYALLDVFFLEEIYEKFLEIITQNQRLGWFLEEMQNFINKNLLKSDDSLSKNFAFRGKSESQIVKIKNLILWREIWARKIDVPRQHFIKDEMLERIALGQEVTKNFTAEMQGEINKILDAKEELFVEIDSEKREMPMTSKQKEKFAEAKILLAKIAAQKKFQEQFLITSSDLKKIICEKKISNKIVAGWRYQVFGEELKQLIS
jgi:ribonuclease D